MLSRYSQARFAALRRAKKTAAVSGFALILALLTLGLLIGFGFAPAELQALFAISITFICAALLLVAMAVFPRIAYTSAQQQSLLSSIKSTGQHPELFEHLANYAPVMIWTSDKNRSMQFLSARWLQFTGRDLSQELGNGWLSCVHPDHLSRFAISFNSAAERDESFEVEFRLRRKDNEYRWMLCRGSPVFDLLGNLTGFIGSCLDITDMKRAQELMRQAQERAENNAQVKNDFLANMSHEMRTPLNGVIGLTELVLESELGREQKEHLTLVQRSAKHLQSLVSDLLDISKLERGALTAVAGPVPIRRVLDDIEALFKPSFVERGIEIVVDVSPSIPSWVVSDDGRLRQILTNVLGNAVKFCATGGAVLLIAEPKRRTGTSLAIDFHICDSGGGIAPEHQAQIFQAFTQADASSTRKYEGAGLGLTIAYKLAKLLGGEITLESKVGRGSRFTISVTVGLLDEAVERKPERLTNQETGHELGQQLRILMVEDNPVNQRLAQRILERAEHHVTLANNGLEAVKAFESGCNFDLVLMDLQMPVMDGLEATTRIRASKFGATVPIIALTARAMSQDKEKCFLAGMDGFATKPLDRAELRNEIHRVISGVGIGVQMKSVRTPFVPRTADLN